MNVSVIDIGSNTVKASIFSVADRRRKVLDYKGYKSKLIADVVEVNGERVLSSDGINKLEEALKGLIDFSNNYACRMIFAFATASLRGIANIDEVLNYVKEKTDIDIDVLTGEEEALCSLRGLLSDESMEGVDEGIMVDMGGGSTEIVYFSNGKSPMLKSLPFGCVSLYNRFVKGNVPTEAEVEAIENYVLGELSACGYAKGAACPMFLIGGSGRAVRKIASGGKDTNRLKADGSDFTAVIEGLRDKAVFDSAEELIPGRSLTVSPAAAAYRKIASFVSPTAIIVSESGVREGYLEKILP